MLNCSTKMILSKDKNVKIEISTKPTGSSWRRPPCAWVGSSPIVIVAHSRRVQPGIQFPISIILKTQDILKYNYLNIVMKWLKPRVVGGCKPTSSSRWRCTKTSTGSQILIIICIICHTLSESPHSARGQKTFQHFLQLWKTGIPGGVVAVRGVIASGSSPIQGGSG